MLQLKQLRLKSDYRIPIIREKLNKVDRILTIVSGKGGVGKTVIACCLGIAIAKLGYNVCILDLDFTGPTCHIVLGVDVDRVKLEEYKGLKPYRILQNLYLFTISFLTGRLTMALKGVDQVNALREILTILNMDDIQILILDTPPTLGDLILELGLFREKLEFIAITTRSKLSLSTVMKAINSLRDSRCRILGLVENMAAGKDDEVLRFCGSINIKYLGRLPYDPNLEKAYGDVNAIVNTCFYKHVTKIARRLIALK